MSRGEHTQIKDEGEEKDEHQIYVVQPIMLTSRSLSWREFLEWVQDFLTCLLFFSFVLDNYVKFILLFCYTPLLYRCLHKKKKNNRKTVTT